MRVADQAVGGLLIAASVIIFSYYTVWVFVLPFAEKDSILHNYFLPQHYAVAIPAALLMIGICGISAFIGIVMMKEAAKKKSK